MIPRKSYIKRGKPPKRKTDKRKAMQQLDLLAKAVILARDGNRCLKCGKAEGLQAAHIMPKGSNPRMRWMTLNLLTLCLRCHLFWAHKDPLGFTRWLEETLPGRHEQLLLWQRQAAKPDLKLLKLVLETELQTFGAGGVA